MMDTKLSVALLSGISLFLSLGAFAVSDEAGDNLNWSYAMGGTIQAESSDFDELTATLPRSATSKEVTCTEGCPARAPKPMVLTYEDEALPIADRMDTEPEVPVGAYASSIPVREKVEQREGKVPQQLNVSGQQIETRYVESNPQTTQYPITRQYPISVQYPITVQRNMTVEQPVIMQQPVIVRRPVVVQQDVMVQRQPTFIQQQPMIMQQQPSFIQQQPMYVQAPAAPMTQETLNSINGMLAQPQIMVAPQPQMLTMPMMSNAYVSYPQQYQVQGQIQAQPIYTMPAMYMQPQMMQQPQAY